MKNIEVYNEPCLVIFYKSHPVNTYSWELWHKESLIDFGGGFYGFTGACIAGTKAYLRQAEKHAPGRNARLADLIYRPTLLQRLRDKIRRWL